MGFPFLLSAKLKPNKKPAITSKTIKKHFSFFFCDIKSVPANRFTKIILEKIQFQIKLMTLIMIQTK